MIKAIIFDMDGVMIDTELQSNLGWYYAFDKACKEFPMWLCDSFKGASPKDSAVKFDEFYKTQSNADSAKEELEYFLKTGEIKYLNYWCMRLIRSKHVHDIRKVEGVPVKKGLIKLLKYARDNKLTIAVATSTKRESATKSLTSIGAMDYLTAVVYGDEVTRSKPNPDIFLEAADRIDCKPSECMVIEDSINGIIAADAAGMKVVHIPDTILIDDNIKAKTDYICENLECVIDLIENMKSIEDMNLPENKKSIENVKDSGDNVKAVIYGSPRLNFIFVDRAHVRKTFADYVDGYNMSDVKIRLKAEHTYRVAALCERIAKASGVGAYDAEIAWLSGMLHDIGRFEQVKRYGTFLDSISVNHAEFGADILFKDGLIDDFLDGYSKFYIYERTIDKKENADAADSYGDKISEPGTSENNHIGNLELKKSDISLLELVIRAHNRYRIPTDLSEREKALCNILRDADKVDILRVNYETGMEAIYDVSREELYNSDISDEVYEAFFRESSIPRDKMCTVLDHMVGHISLVYELVYDESLKAVLEQGYLDKIMEFQSDNLTSRRKLEKITEHMREYIRKRTNL